MKSNRCFLIFIFMLAFTLLGFHLKSFFCMVLAGILVCRLPQLFLCFIAIFSDCLFFLSASFFFSSHCHLQPGYIRDLVSSPYLKKKERIKTIYRPSYKLPSWINFPLLFEQIGTPKWVNLKTNLSNYSFRKILKSLQWFLVLETCMAGTHSDQISWYWT